MNTQFMRAVALSTVKLPFTFNRSMATPYCMRKKKVFPNIFVGKVREDFKKDARERATENGNILAVLQDSDGSRMYLSLVEKPVRRVHLTPGFYNTAYGLEIEGKEPMHCIVKHLDFDPVREWNLRHLTLLRYRPNSNIKVPIPLKFLNEDKCPGLQKGGILNLIVPKITCLCNKPEIPLYFELDLANVDIGDR